MGKKTRGRFLCEVCDALPGSTLSLVRQITIAGVPLFKAFASSEDP